MIDQWGAFFTATAGSGAALAGLIIVAMAANVTRIIAIPSMTARAGATIASLVLIVVASVAVLIPQQPPVLLGVEILVFGPAVLAFAVDSGVRMIRAAAPVGPTTLAKAAAGIGQIVPFIVAGGFLLFGDIGGLYWVAAGMLLVFIGSVANTWVLLVEILR